MTEIIRWVVQAPLEMICSPNEVEAKFLWLTDKYLKSLEEENIDLSGYNLSLDCFKLKKSNWVMNHEQV